MLSDKVIKQRNELFQKLKSELSSTQFFVRPRSPKKYEADEESTIVICFPNDTHQILGFPVQEKTEPYKIWFNDHPEWELLTKYPVVEFAKNGSGAGCGKGFYIESLNHCIAEIKDFLEQYYSN